MQRLAVKGMRQRGASGDHVPGLKRPDTDPSLTGRCRCCQKRSHHTHSAAIASSFGIMLRMGARNLALLVPSFRLIS